LLALQRLDETSAQLQKQGNYLEALECMERGLVLRQHMFGADSEEVWKACKTVGEMCNLLAMTYLQQEDFNMVLELLKKAEILTERDAAGRAATYNNLACYYRRQGKLHAALQYLQKALKIESKLSNVQNPADPHINACAVLSQLGRHQTALEHAQSALILLQEELLSPPGVVGSAPPQADRIAVLAIAYHNIGVEQEFLKRFEHSVLSYKKGVEVAERYLGSKHAITKTLTNSLAAAKKSAAAMAYRSGGSRGQAEAKETSTKTKRTVASSKGSPERPMEVQHAMQAGRGRSLSPDAKDDFDITVPGAKALSPPRRG
jgi:tetratricopeptide (TPR) repeat protein